MSETQHEDLTLDEPQRGEPETVAENLLGLMADAGGLPTDFSAKSIPDELMRVPIDLAVGWLDAHRRSCRKKRSCPDTPGPLRPFLNFHSRKALAEQTHRIHIELWRSPESTMVREVRNAILDDEQTLAESLSDDASLTEGAARGISDSKQCERIAAVLWALQMHSSGQRILFRLLPVLSAERRPPEQATTDQSKVAGEKAVEKERHKRRRQDAEARVTELEEEVATLRIKLKERAGTVAEARKELEKAETEWEVDRQRLDESEHDRDSAQIEVASLQADLRRIEKDARRARSTNEQSARDLKEIDRRLEDALADRSRITRELALTRTELETSKTMLASVPRGADSVHAFLGDEETRIDQNLTILQGGDKRRAEAEHAAHRRLEKSFLEAYPEFVAPRPASLGAKRTLSFTALGGGSEVGRSCYLLEVGASKILVDCGIAVGREDLTEMIPNLELAHSLDAVILTHAHTDHIGWLAALTRRIDDSIPLHCSEDTAAILPTMLSDARRQYERFLADRQLIAEHGPGAEVPEEAYGPDDPFEAQTRLHAVRFDEPIDLPGTSMKATFFPAGHILGAASVLLEGGGRRIMFSGDISSQHQATVAAANPPQNLEDVDLLVLESTYGDRNRDDDNARLELVEFVKKTIEHGTALLPCFALGRGQEVLQILLKAKKAGDLPDSLEIWVDGMIREILPFYVERERVDRDGYSLVGAGERPFAIARCERPDAKAAVITTSGMMSGGPIIEWARRLLPDPRNRLALLGYQDEGSIGGALGRLLKSKARPPYNLPVKSESGGTEALRIGGSLRTLGLSAHADQRGLIDFALKIRPRKIALVHGDPDAQAALKEALHRELPTTAVIASGSRRLDFD